jgi:anaerobic magnesium-protoporphyrin IX monomethyl ester cyclase
MKILLIYPPDFNMIRTNVPAFVDEETGLYPPLGLMYIAGHLQHSTDYNIEMLDTQVDKMTYGDIKKAIEDKDPDVVGIQAMTFTLLDAIETARCVKKIKPQAHVCLGGPHVNIYPQESISFPEVDSLVLGEGEYIFTDLVRALADKKDLRTVSGIVYKRKGEIINTGKRPFIEDLDKLSFPARKLLPIQKYYSALAKKNPITTMMTSRGCPFRCIFCDRPHLGKLFRARSAQNVVGEMEDCVGMGIRELFLYDDTFSINRKRVVDICETIIKKGLKINWDIRARVDTLDKDLIGRLKDAGCCRMHLGIEAGNARILKILNKDIDLKQAETVFSLARKAGIATLGYFMIGNPTETRQEILETIQFARNINADYAHIAVATPFPATKLYLMGLEQGIFKEDYWKSFAKNPTPEFRPKLWEENLKEQELIDLLRDAYRSFYMRPQYLFRKVLEVRSLDEAKIKFKAGINLLKGVKK